MAAPAGPVLDSFNRANETPLSGGGNWQARTESGGASQPLNLISNEVGAPSVLHGYGVWLPAGSLGDCEAYATFRTVGTDRNIVCVRYQGSTGTADAQFLGVEYSSGAGGLSLVSFSAGGIARFGTTSAWTPAAGDKYGVTIAGMVAQAWSFSSGSWTLRITKDFTGASPGGTFTSGYIGMTIRGTTGRLDDFGGGAIVSGPPVADFTGTPLTGTAPLSVTFTDTSTNAPSSWSWDFGDGGTSTSQNPSHSYSSSGVYTVALTATNASGSNTKTRTGYVTASEAITYASGAGLDIW